MVSPSSSTHVRMGKEEKEEKEEKGEEGEEEEGGKAEEREERRASNVVSLETVSRRISPLKASLKVTVSKWSILWLILRITMGGRKRGLLGNQRKGERERERTSCKRKELELVSVEEIGLFLFLFSLTFDEKRKKKRKGKMAEPCSSFLSFFQTRWAILSRKDQECQPTGPILSLSLSFLP
jgi:hypothetical protein